MKKVIVIKGRPQSGKSTAIKALYNALQQYLKTREYNEVSEDDILKAYRKVGDIKETISIDDIDISLAGHGDKYNELERILEDMDNKGWDIFVCCCHLYNRKRSTHKLIKERYEALKIPIQWEKMNLYKDIKDKITEEKRLANLLLEKILAMQGVSL